ncbi:MAG: phosphotransferase [Mariprofundales bacterium]|nr:phosphotransferase [Mariprofundales bacterium]
MVLAKPLSSNLRFLLLEADAQLGLFSRYLASEDADLLAKVMARSGYVYNLNLRIQHGGDAVGADAMTARTVASIAAEVARIVDLTRDGMQQFVGLHSGHRLDLHRFRSSLRMVAKQLAQVEKALQKRDTPLALKIGQGEAALNRRYYALRKRLTAQLKDTGHPEDLVTGLMVARMLAQMGEALLRISEELISHNLGQPMDMPRFHALQQAVDGWKGDGAMAQMEVTPVAATRSGSGISAISGNDASSPQAIYKNGARRKLKEERRGVKAWHAIYPGVAPKVLSYHKHGDSAGLLIEHLPGLTFEQIVLHESVCTMAKAMAALGETVTAVWRVSRSERCVSARFVQQTRKRLADLYAVHPSFRQDRVRIGKLEIPSFARLLAAAERIEKRLAPPPSVLIHGDFNVDNILYDPQREKIHFIDLHRATQMDLVQDVSVFMVSNYRLQVFDAPVRRRIRKQVADFYAIARKFANKEHDDTFELRLALGLARSFATSTRFILDRAMAKQMFLRAHYLLELVVACDVTKPKQFRLPIKELFYG